MRCLVGFVPVAAICTLATLALGCGGGSGGTGQTTFAAYLVPPQPPTATDSSVIALLSGSSTTAQAGMIVVHLQGTPYQVGFQNGYLTAQSAEYAAYAVLGDSSSSYRISARSVARSLVWSKVPSEYQEEMQGIADGLKAAGCTGLTLWDVVALNAYCDYDCYASTLAQQSGIPTVPGMALDRAPLGGCSAFIATGDATADGLPVMGHTTWTSYSTRFMSNVVFYVHPQSGYDFCYQAFGGLIWSGRDWYQNSAGLLLTETTLADTVYTPGGSPVFVRARKAAQYAATVDQAVDYLRTDNNGAYSNEWLIGDANGEIASLMLGGKTDDLSVTYNGFFGSSNFDWGPNTRAEEGSTADRYVVSGLDYGRYVRWGQLKAQYYGQIDAEVGKAMISDTYDPYTEKIQPDARTLCGEPENATPGVSNSYCVKYLIGSTDGKVCTERMAKNGLQMWACWGHPSGNGFDADLYLTNHPTWSATYGAFCTFGLKTFSAAGPNAWALFKQ